jgi:hypothetical protein
VTTASHGDVGEGEHGDAADGLAKEAGRLKAAEEQHILDLRTRGDVGGSGEWSARCFVPVKS